MKSLLFLCVGVGVAAYALAAGYSGGGYSGGSIGGYSGGYRPGYSGGYGGFLGKYGYAPVRRVVSVRHARPVYHNPVRTYLASVRHIRPVAIHPVRHVHRTVVHPVQVVRPVKNVQQVNRIPGKPFIPNPPKTEVKYERPVHNNPVQQIESVKHVQPISVNPVKHVHQTVVHPTQHVQPVENVKALTHVPGKNPVKTVKVGDGDNYMR